MISRIALIAAAGLLLGAAMTPARAADLGGGCCADLEERVAELEATTARKGNRVVSLQIYGTVAKGLLIWDNGDNSDAYVVDDDAITSVLGFKGEATIKPGWKTGFKVELAVTDATSALVTETDDEGNNGTISIRHSYVYIESERLGRVSIGQQSEASDGAAEVTLANTLVGPNPDHGGSIRIGGNTTFTLGNFASDLDGNRNDLIRYDSPSIYGFIVSASWGDNDYYDVALRFAKEWNSIKIAAAVAYAKWDPQSPDATNGNDEFSRVIGSISVMHVPTGLFAAVSAGEVDFDDLDRTESFWYTQAGIERKWLPYGTTTVYGEYGKYDDFAFEGSEATRWGFGAVQHFDSASLDLYARAIFWSFDGAAGQQLEDMSTVFVGAKIDF
jgi:predicted porin